MYRPIDKDGVTQTTTRGIMHTFVEFLQRKYEPIQVDDACVTRMEKVGHRTEVCHPRCAFKLYGEVNSLKKHNYKIWLNDGVYWQGKTTCFGL